MTMRRVFLTWPTEHRTSYHGADIEKCQVMALTLLSASCGGADTPNAGVGWGTLPDEVCHARAEAFWTAAEAVGVSRDRFFAEAKDSMHDALWGDGCVVSALAPAVGGLVKFRRGGLAARRRRNSRSGEEEERVPALLDLSFQKLPADGEKVWQVGEQVSLLWVSLSVSWRVWAHLR